METGEYRGGRKSVRWGDVLLSAVASVSWAFVGMAGTAALGLHLLGADAAGSLGPMTAAAIALGVGGSVTPSGDVSAFGLKGAEAHTAIDVMPLGVGLAGAVLLAFFFSRSLRGAGVVITPGELAARAGAVIALFVALLGGLAWAGHDIITIDGEKLGLDKGIDKGLDELPGGIGDKLPGGIGDIGGLLPDRIGDLVKAKAAVGFTVDTGATLLAGAVFAAGVLLIALLASRRTPLPYALDGLHRVVRPAASALVTVLLVAVLAGLAAAAYAMIGDAHPKRIAGAALLGTPNGVWLGVPLGLFVPWDGTASGQLTQVLPDPVDDLLAGKTDEPLTLGRLAELDGRVWLLGVAAALMILFAGVLTAVRTPVPGHGPGAAGREVGALGFAGRCALRLGAVTALALPLLVWLTGVSADASLSVLGFDAVGAGLELHGRTAMALVLGAAWGAGAGAAGALLAWATGAAGGGVAPLAVAGVSEVAGVEGAREPADVRGSAGLRGDAPAGRQAGPYEPGEPSYRPPNPDTNPYLRPPGAQPPPRRDESARPPSRRDEDSGAPSRRDENSGAPSAHGGSSGAPPDDVAGAPTMVGPITPPPRPKPPSRNRPRPQQDGEWPPPPPPPPPPPKDGPPRRRPRGER
ncbi:streptophobe family protein [Streptomyces sp. NPDC059009]|uniref:streptophobe family protein n=1 Tax=Streptomyces sp. NPDC059009 TaxID=3346694 RepID=UPI003673E8A0